VPAAPSFLRCTDTACCDPALSCCFRPPSACRSTGRKSSPPACSGDAGFYACGGKMRHITLILDKFYLKLINYINQGN
jgi:hypothetical protein